MTWHRRNGTFIEAIAPAKINLFLEVLGRRDDGFHDIETLITAISLFDRLQIRPQSAGSIDVECGWLAGREAHRVASSRHGTPPIWQPLPAPQENLVYRVVQRFKERAGVEKGLHVRVWKGIPAEAGLGGASSDAATALLAANAAWGVGWPAPRLAELAGELGSDIPFFFRRGAALCTGRGQDCQPAPAARLQLVVIRPPEGLSTARVYQRCQPGRSPRSAAPILEACAGRNPRRIAAELFNRLETPAMELSPGVAAARDALASTGCLGHLMTGSGASCFGIYRTAREARRAARALRSRYRGGVFQAVALAAVGCSEP